MFWGSGIYFKVDSFAFGLWYIFSRTSLFGSVVRVVAALYFPSHPSSLTFIVLFGGDFLVSLFSGPGLRLDLVVLSGLALIFGIMPPKLALTFGLDVSGLAVSLSRSDVAQQIMNRFSAFKISAIQFVGTIAKVTFANKADRESVMRRESITINDVVCPVPVPEDFCL